MRKILFLLFSFACSIVVCPAVYGQGPMDFDNDGYTNEVDCIDTDPAINPGAKEICDGRDNNCNGQTDEGFFVWLFEDRDGDGYGGAGPLWRAPCTTSNYSLVGGDCQDFNPMVNPDAAEICDGLDNNCDGQIDEGFWGWIYTDFDGDGYGANGTGIWRQLCLHQTGYATVAGDCNDSNPAVNPGAPEVCDGADNDCDGSVDEGFLVMAYRDFDGDGFGQDGTGHMRQICNMDGYATEAGDCNDFDATITPSKAEICDGKDNDCDGQIDEEATGFPYFRDADGDGFGDPNSSKFLCKSEAGYVFNNSDCDDTDPKIYPDAIEICDGKDNDCDGSVDEGFSTILLYRDADGDGWGNANEKWEGKECLVPTSGYVAHNRGDCNDADPFINPGAAEVCNGVDDDCDGETDEGVHYTYYRDADGDGFGDAASPRQDCNQPTGYVTNNEDCNDSKVLYSDHDGDGFGSSNKVACIGVENSSDCDDFNAIIHPNTIWYLDADGDGHYTGSVQSCTYPGPGYTRSAYFQGDCAPDDHTRWRIGPLYKDTDNDGYDSGTETVCYGSTVPPGYKSITMGTDCSDNNQAISPGAIEIWDGIDNNCNGDADEGIFVYELEPIHPAIINEGVEHTFTVTVNGGNRVDMVFSLEGDVPDGASIDPQTGAFKWTPTETQGPGTYTFKVVVELEGLPDLKLDRDVTITVREVNVAPVLAVIGNKTVAAGGRLAFRLTASDLDIPIQVLQYWVSFLPMGASFNTTTGEFSWVPTAQQAGSYTITFSASDGFLADDETITITVNKPNPRLAPTITDFTPSSGPIGTVVTLKGTDFVDITRVSFNDVKAVEFTVIDAATIQVTVPAGATNGRISVSNANGTGNSRGVFKVEVSSFKPSIVTREVVTSKVATEGLQVRTLDNPATNHFTLITQSNKDLLLTIRIMDAVGRTIEVKNGVKANGSIQFGHTYHAGQYYAEVAQGKQRVVVKLIKGKGRGIF